MLSEKVRQMRQTLQSLYTSGGPLDETTFQWVLLALVQLEVCALDAEERAASTEPAPAGATVIFLADHVRRRPATSRDDRNHTPDGDNIA